MKSLRGLPLGLVVVVEIGIATAVAVGATRPACACVAPPSSPVDGVVISVDATGLTDVHGFTLRPSDGGPNLAFILGPLENATQFAPGHLKEHQATGTPIRVFFNRSTGQLVVYRLEDAPPTPT